MKSIILSLTLLFSITAFSQNRIIIKLKDGVSLDKAALQNGRTGIAEIDSINAGNSFTGIRQLRTGKKSAEVILAVTFPQTESSDIIREYMQSGLIEYAEPDYKGSGGGVQSTVNDSFYFRQWGLKNDGSFNMSPAVPGADIDMESAWNIEQGSSDVIVAVMDSGLKMNHPEFSGRLWTNSAEIADNGIDDDGNGYVDDIFGWDYANEDDSPADDQGHGTNVTGIIAANGNNGIGYSGVDRNCKIMVLKGLNSNNSGSYSWWVEAIVYAADNGVDVINLSVGGSSFSASLQSAVNYALDSGVVVVACMMNTETSAPYYPAKFTNVIAVGSTSADDTRTSPFFWDPNSGSNFGSHISVIAPGNFIYGLSHISNNEYGSYWGGTSQATPLVAGLAALLRAQDPERTPAEIKEIIESTAEDQVGNPAEDIPGYDIYYGHGRINAYQALALALSTPEVKVVNTISLYPNPVTDHIFISGIEQVKGSIINMLGQKVLEFDTDSSKPINVTGLPQGTYFVKMEGTASQKFIKE